MGKHSGTNSGLGGFMNGASIRFSKLKQGMGGVDAWRDQLTNTRYNRGNSNRPRTTGTKLPRLHSLHQATVVSMQKFGAFVQLGKGDTYKDGLLHVSNIGPERVETPEEGGLEMGVSIWIKVSDINENELKYSVDMRYVSQKDGTDLDPWQGKGRIPDNFWDRGVFAKKEEENQDEGPLAPPSPPQQGEKRKSGDASESDSSSVSKGVSKKLKKARKKLEKIRKKAEKAKKNNGTTDKDVTKKKKKRKKAKKQSNSGTSDAPRSDSS